jgi:CBS-domain-containing membrane protein
MKLNKEIFTKAVIAGFFSAVTIGVLTVLTYKTTLGLFIAASFGSSMVLLFGFPESPFAQPKNVFFGHLVTALVGGIFCKLYTVANLYFYCGSSWNRNFSNDYFRCGSSTCWWKSNNGYHWKCIL